MRIWKDVTDFEGFYKINDLGEVYSYDRYVRCAHNANRLIKGRKMKAYLGKDGYLYYLLTVNKTSKHYALHRLLAIHFIPNPHNKREVNHIDTNKLNNSLLNLEWATPKENIQHSIKAGTNTQCLPGENNPAAKLTKEKVLQIREMEGNHTDIAKHFNVSRRIIGFIKSKQRWAHV
jgi:hypothetical protein